MNLQRPSWRMGTNVVLTSLLVAVAGTSTQAHAQAWLPDRAYEEGPGIRTGNLELHPGVAVRGGYDTNVFRADGKARTANVGGRTVNATQPIQGAGVLAVTPHLRLTTLSQQRLTQGEDREGAQKALPPIAFRGGLSATYFNYFLNNAPKNFEVDTDMALSILPQRPFSIDASVAYSRSVRPFTQNAYSRNAYNLDTFQPRLRFNFGSRSQVLTGYAGYAPRLTHFESDVFNYLNNLTHVVEAGAAWRFLPSTALVYDASFDLQDYSKSDPATSRSPVLFADNKRFRSRLGINGALTRTLSLRALAGYTLMEFSNKGDGFRLDDHEDVIGEAVLGFHFGPAQSGTLEVGYNRDVLSTALGGWTRLDRGSASLKALIGRVFLLTLEAGAARVNYGTLYGFDRRTGSMVAPLGADNQTHRKDVRLDGAIRGEYRVTNWLSFMADVSAQAVLTKFAYAVYLGDAPIPDPARYFALMAFGGVRAHY